MMTLIRTSGGCMVVGYPARENYPSVIDYQLKIRLSKFLEERYLTNFKGWILHFNMLFTESPPPPKPWYSLGRDNHDKWHRYSITLPAEDIAKAPHPPAASYKYVIDAIFEILTQKFKIPLEDLLLFKEEFEKDELIAKILGG